MPSPLGHALAGLAAGWTVAPASTHHSGRVLRGLVFVVAATAADLDLLIGMHRGPTHSLAAAALAGSVVWLWTRSRRPGDRHGALRRDPGWMAAAVGAAAATHTLLDWLGADSSPPVGLMALWPFSRDYYASHLDIFMAISRRYRDADFWPSNVHAIAREVLILGPVAAVVWIRSVRRRGRTAPSGDRGRRGGG